MPPPSPVWTQKGQYNNATFEMRVKIADLWYASEEVRLNVKGAAQEKETKSPGAKAPSN